jgi:hypothetical protein
VGVAGDFIALYVSQAAGTIGDPGDEVRYMLYKNGAAGNLVVYVPTNQTSGSDTINSDTMAAGDKVAVQATPNTGGKATMPTNIVVTLLLRVS